MLWRFDTPRLILPKQINRSPVTMKSIISKERKQQSFLISLGVLLLVGVLIMAVLELRSTQNILPIVQEGRHHADSLRHPGVFAEDETSEASEGQLVFNQDGTFSLEYIKSIHKDHAFCGAWFPLENINIDFSKYDFIEIGIETEKARRVPFNLSPQTKLETHQYIRTMIEIEKGKDLYTFQLQSFFTPTSWYERNKVAQIDIESPDLSKIEALSFESCHLLDKGVADRFTINQLILRKDLSLEYIIVISIVLIAGFGIWVWLFDPFKKSEVIHVPISNIEVEEEAAIDAQLLIYLGNNYTNPNLTLADLAKEFGKNNQEISQMIKEQTKMTFPKYLNYLRIEEAKRLLREGTIKSVSEIGYAVGFNSPSNFNRVFKGAEGISPKAFQEKAD